MGRVVIGVDPHKRSNTALVLDDRERVLGKQRFGNRNGYPALRPIRSGCGPLKEPPVSG